MTNPFENDNDMYKVLINEEGQHSVWPAFLDVPAGWSVVHDNDSRQACLTYIELHWTDMMPKRLHQLEYVSVGK
ncbi:MbtH family protein [Bacillus cytotoxicus]|uniref:MbtH domain protein n=2 Tax=Bacillus cytotoxicus TaxID=580165 RepID=A0AAX2CGG6_9BACI|nr:MULTISPECIES: MbtH family protein [Bacillus cereus group]ABS22059.1 MbtH domain protein [Bacillus cytotoxicus NVH 391-98]AWC28666.1 MbtH family protein [Bacillus cytotoxicus]AWC32680.1 MbtH family protein [Bacillus cytotoxicus]AWC36709.1 MbtH family protein [Bacillus cytotoxicus]AWC39951.1 MbtH family protein [Bacillus cytotoxicus]